MRKHSAAYFRLQGIVQRCRACWDWSVKNNRANHSPFIDTLSYPGSLTAESALHNIMLMSLQDTHFDISHLALERFARSPQTARGGEPAVCNLVAVNSRGEFMLEIML
jgi:hypothetical protein